MPRNMKTKSLLIIGLAAAALQLVPSGFAQAPAVQNNEGRGRHHRMHANLSVDERTKLWAARRRALEDPAVQAARDRRQQANREYRQLMHASMLKADPSVQPILEKVPARAERD